MTSLQVGVDNRLISDFWAPRVSDGDAVLIAAVTQCNIMHDTYHVYMLLLSEAAGSSAVAMVNKQLQLIGLVPV